MKKAGIFLFLGMLIGTALAGPAVEAASGILAERSTQVVFVDGVNVSLEAYNIGGSNYVKLRDIGKEVNFNVYWNGAVQIDTKSPYSGIPPDFSGGDPEMEPAADVRDFSSAVNPSTFTGIYTTEAYNAAAEVLDGLHRGDFSRSAVVHIGNQEDRWKLESVLGDLSYGVTLSLRAKAEGVFEVYAHDVFKTAVDGLTEELIGTWANLPTDREKVAAVNQYLCDRLIFDPERGEGVYSIVSGNAPLRGNCVTFARSVNYFCRCLDIPCITVHGEHHYWNAVYCEGQWSYVDVSANDQTASHDYILLSQKTPKQISDPYAVRFLEELLVPNSTR